MAPGQDSPSPAGLEARDAARSREQKLRFGVQRRQEPLLPDWTSVRFHEERQRFTARGAGMEEGRVERTTPASVKHD